MQGLILRERAGTDLNRLVKVARESGFRCVFAHSRHPGAAECGADGIHFPDDGNRGDQPFIWGRSTHSPQAARAAVSQGASLVLLSPIWSPSSKPDDLRPTLGTAALVAAGEGPILALGGIDAFRAEEVRKVGGYGVAVLGALFDAANPHIAGERAREFVSRAD